MGAAAFTFRHERRPGDGQLIVDLHRLGYTVEGDRFGPPFWEFVAETVAEAQLDQPSRSRVWFAELDGKAVGCSALVDRGEIGQLRWVVLLPEARGTGAGRKLVELALDHARDCGHAEVFLETTDGLGSSMAIYEKLGFQTSDVHVEPLWHGDGLHITMTLHLKPSIKMLCERGEAT